MTPNKSFISRVSPVPVARRTTLILLIVILALIIVAGVAWAARSAIWPTGLSSFLPADATATPTRTPRPETATPTPARVHLTIVLPTALAAPTRAPVATLAPTPAAPGLPGWLAPVVERYGMDASRRFVVIDLATQQMVAWDPGHEARSMPVSTGDETRGYRTLAWYGLVGDYWGTFNAFGVYADEGWYLFEDAGHILIHSTPYKLINGQKVYEEMDALGAYPASKGCIRLAPEDAAWFTAWRPRGVPIVILPKDAGMGAG